MQTNKREPIRGCFNVVLLCFVSCFVSFCVCFCSVCFFDGMTEKRSVNSSHTHKRTDGALTKRSGSHLSPRGDDTPSAQQRNCHCTPGRFFFCGRKAERESRKSDCPKELHRNPFPQTNLASRTASFTKGMTPRPGTGLRSSTEAENARTAEQARRALHLLMKACWTLPCST